LPLNPAKVQVDSFWEKSIIVRKWAIEWQTGRWWPGSIKEIQQIICV
jgi:hypothetical protein